MSKLVELNIIEVEIGIRIEKRLGISITNLILNEIGQVGYYLFYRYSSLFKRFECFIHLIFHTVTYVFIRFSKCKDMFTINSISSNSAIGHDNISILYKTFLECIKKNIFSQSYYSIWNRC